jgi:hypothetical protein
MTIMDEREAARAAGLSRYTSTIPCRRAGHVGERYASNGGCIQCIDNTKVPAPLGVKKKLDHPQRLELNIILPSMAWREIWTQEHTNQATVRLQAALNGLLKEWVDAMPPDAV